MKRSGYTLIEMLVATTLTMMLMFAVAQLFASVGDGIANSRSTLEMTESLRGVASRLREDLQGATVKMNPPRSPETNEGYFEIIEGPIGPVAPPSNVAIDTTTSAADTTVGDFDDILMFTTRSQKVPFVGRVAGAAASSSEAEVAWFVRGRTLYRRVLLVRPDVTPSGTPAGFYANNDLSVRNVSGTLYANSLADLTLRENRFAHATGAYPFDSRGWGVLGLPTLQECSSNNWNAGAMQPGAAGLKALLPSPPKVDLWQNPYPWDDGSGNAVVNTTTGCLLNYQGSRIAEDVILQNVIGFDVKVWDPGAPVFQHTATGVTLLPGDAGYKAAFAPANIVGFGAYVDLNYLAGSGINYTPVAGAPLPLFSGPGDSRSGLVGAAPATAAVYDTWSSSHEAGQTGTDGFDNNNDGVVDDPGEWVTAPPYRAPLRGIQVKIRVYEPSSRQIREVTVVQEFVTK
jgi:type II secretory pathway component PulJ